MKKLLYTIPLLILGFLFFAPQVHAAISLGAVSTSSASTASATTSVTVGTGSNQVLVAIIQGNSTHVDPSTAISYDGQSMTSSTVAASANSRVDLWYLANPNQGTFNATTSFSGGTVVQNLTFLVFNGVNTSNPIDGTASGTANSATTPATISVTTSNTNDWIIGGVTADGLPAYTAGSGQTVLYAGFCYAPSGECATGYLSNVSAGANTFQWNYSFTNSWASAAIALQPASTPPTSTSSSFILSSGSLSCTSGNLVIN